MVVSVLSTIVTSTGNFIKDSVDDAFLQISQVGYSQNPKYAWLRLWPCYLSGAIAVASTVATIAAAVFQDIPQAVFYGLIALSSWIVTGTVHVFIPLKSIEENKAALKEREVALNKSAADLARQAARINELEQRQQDTTADFAEQLARRERENRLMNDRESQHLRELEVTTNKLLASEQRTKCLEELLQSIKGASDGFLGHVQTFEGIRADISHKGNEIVGATTGLTRVSQALAEQVKSLEHQHGVVMDEYQTAIRFANNLSSVFSAMQTVYQKTREEEELVRSELEQMKRNAQFVHTTTQDFSSTVDRLQKALEQAQKQSPFK